MSLIASCDAPSVGDVRPTVLQTPPAGGEKSAEVQAAKRAQIENDLAWFTARWPLAFDRENPRPLAIGVGEHIIAAAVADGRSKTQVVRTLRFWTSSLKYLRACWRKGAMRIDLDGSVVEPVSELHAANACERAQGIKNKQRRERMAPHAEAVPGEFSRPGPHRTSRPQIRLEAKP